MTCTLVVLTRVHQGVEVGLARDLLHPGEVGGSEHEPARALPATLIPGVQHMHPPLTRELVKGKLHRAP